MMELRHGSRKAARFRNGNRTDLFYGSMGNVGVLLTCYPTGVLIVASRRFYSWIWQEYPLVSGPPELLVRYIQTINKL
jgi:hypothetical protein